MSTIVKRDLEIPRNADYFQEWRLLDPDGAESSPIDLTGCTLELDVRAFAGEGVVIASATIDVVEATDGRFTVLIHGSDFAATGEPSTAVSLAYDLRLTYPDGVQRIPIRGHVIATPGAVL